MAAILRVKRRHDDEPSNALVISCKRQKTTKSEETESESPVPLTTVVKFAGTVKKQEDSVEHIIKSYSKDELKAHYKGHAVDVLNKVRQERRQASAENRYKVINCIRSLGNSDIEDSDEKLVTLIDVEDSQSVAKEDAKEKEDNYVYDLYYVQPEEEMYLDDMVCVYPYEQELVYDTYREGYSEFQCESEDSNSESNWRNDYPDSNHSERSIDEDDVREAVMNMRLEDGSDLSEEDDFVYALDEIDVDTYGYEYARYKARVRQELQDESEDDDLKQVRDFSEDSGSSDTDDESDSFMIP